MQPDEDSSGEGELPVDEPSATAVFAKHVADYRKAYSRLRGEAGLGQRGATGHIEHLGRPDGKACKDYHRQCPEWADSVRYWGWSL